MDNQKLLELIVDLESDPNGFDKLCEMDPKVAKSYAYNAMMLFAERWGKLSDEEKKQAKLKEIDNLN